MPNDTPANLPKSHDWDCLDIFLSGDGLNAIHRILQAEDTTPDLAISWALQRYAEAKGYAHNRKDD